MTVDIEDWYHIPSVSGSPFSVYKDVDDFFNRWAGKYDYLSEPTRRVLDIFDQFDITATFFIVADVVEHYPGLVDLIVDRGHEIACHGLHHMCKVNPISKEANVSVQDFVRMTGESKKILESVSKNKIIGYRSPNALIAGWMIDALENLDFNYDSSVNANSLFRKATGTLDGVSTYPYYPEKNSLVPGKRRGIIEFPWAYLDVGLKIPTSGGPMLRFLGANLIIKGLKQSLKRGHTIFYFHPIDISNEQFPRIGKNRPGYWMIKGKVVEKRIIRILSEFGKVNKITLGEASKLYVDY